MVQFPGKSITFELPTNQDNGDQRQLVTFMEYIVHGSKNQNDSKLKLTLERFA